MHEKALVPFSNQSTSLYIAHIYIQIYTLKAQSKRSICLKTDASLSGIDTSYTSVQKYTLELLSVT